jgi:AhpD family alkylhydroperoxidase
MIEGGDLKEVLMMTMINITKLLRQSLPVSILVLVAVLGMTFTLDIAKAEDSTSSEEAVAEMKKMFGKIPPRMQNYPESAKAAGWALIKSTDLNKNTALPLKVRELIGLAVASQIPCKYCIYYHQRAAKAAGASEEEIREAVHVSSVVRHWSTVLYGNESDFEAFKAEVDAAFKSQ